MLDARSKQKLDDGPLSNKKVKCQTHLGVSRPLKNKVFKGLEVDIQHEP